MNCRMIIMVAFKNGVVKYAVRYESFFIELAKFNLMNMIKIHKRFNPFPFFLFPKTFEPDLRIESIFEALKGINVNEIDYIKVYKEYETGELRLEVMKGEEV